MRVSRLRTSSIFLSPLLCMALSATALGQSYPSRPIRIVTGEAGGASELGARVMAPTLAKILAQPVVIENRPSALSIDVVAKAAPDGYTFLVGPNSIWIEPLLRKTSWDALQDFSAISLLTASPNIIVVHASVPANTVKELIDWIKANPGKVNYGSSGNGTSTHLAGELFKQMGGLDLVRIPYKGGAANMVALLRNEVQVSFSTGGTVTQHLKSGKLKALAVASARPSPLMAGVPTASESGLPGFESGTLSAMLAPAKTPDAFVQRMSSEVSQFLKTPAIREQLLKAGVEAVGSSPEELVVIMKAEIARWGKVAQQIGPIE